MGLLSDEYFSGGFNTGLTPEEEAIFVEWAKKNNRLEDLQDYDLRGFWKDQMQFAENGHGSDKYKKPNHPTFSDQSIYHNTQMPNGEKFVGGTWEENRNGVSYTPSANMLRYTHPLDWLNRYMSEVEPGVRLNMDRRGLLGTQ